MDNYPKRCEPSYCTLPTRPIRKLLTPIDIIEMSCNRLGVLYEELITPYRAREVTNPRFMIMYLLRKHTSLTLAEVACLFKRKRHETVISAIKKTNIFIEREKEFREKLEDLEDHIFN